jgi:hypothetical protein
MQYFLDSGLDWHIGVVSTDMADNSKSGKLQGAGGVRYLDPDTPNPIELYNQMARLGINGSSDEMGRRAAMKALTDPLLNGFNQGFYRDEASLSVIVISDEPDYSGTEPTANEFINFLNALKPDAEDVEFSSIVAPEQGCALASYPGTDYIRVTNAVGGLFQNICSADWVPMLDALGLQAAGLKREYFLSELPIEDTIQVWVEDDGFIYDGIDRARIEAGEDPSDLCESGTCFEYTYEPVRNSILMYDYIPNPLAKINIHYELLSEYEPQAGDESL